MLATILHIKQPMSGHSILLLDPSKNLLNTYRMILEGESYLVDTALTTSEVFLLLAWRQYSVIITEYFPHPEQETSSMIQWVKQNSPETCIIMITNTLIDGRVYENLFASGLDDLIVKPYPPEKVLVHIRKGLRQRDLILQKQELEKRASLNAIFQQSGRFKESFRQELKRAKRHRHPLSLLTLHVREREKTEDHIDRLFSEIVKVLRKYLREEDILGRDSGNLGILLPETGQAESQTLLQRLSNLVQAHPVFQSDKTLSSTIQSLSFESFTYPDTGFVPESLRPVLEELNNEYPTH